MKSVYLIVGLVGLILIGIMLAQTPKDAATSAAETPIVDDQTSTNDTDAESTQMGMTAEEHAAMMGDDVTSGTDVGMEMPDMPMTATETDTPETSMPGMDHGTMGMTAPETKMIVVSGKNFEFDKKEIRVKQGDSVMIHFTSTDGFHDWVIDEFNARTEKVRTGDMAMVTFVADKKGTFEYYCSVGSHRANGMVGKLIVE